MDTSVKIIGKWCILNSLETNEVENSKWERDNRQEWAKELKYKLVICYGGRHLERWFLKMCNDISNYVQIV